MPREPSSSPFSTVQLSTQSLLFDRLRFQQTRSHNLTTYDSKVANGLAEIPYPTLDEGELAPPHTLWGLHYHRDFPQIRCFHDVAARIWTVNGLGPYAGMTFIGCTMKQRSQCSFKICVDKLLNKQGLRTQHYPLKQATPEMPSGSQFAGDELEAMAREIVPASQEDNDLELALQRSLEDIKASLRLRRDLLTVESDNLYPRARYGLSVTPPPAPNYSLQPPASQDPNHAYAAALTTPFSNQPSGSSNMMLRHVTPVRGNTDALFRLDTEEGLPADIFWKMFLLCHGCKHVMVGGMLEDHVCNLTEDS